MLPTGIVENLIKRIKSQGGVNLKNHVYYRDAAKLNQNGFQNTYKESLRTHGSFVKELVLFSKTHGMEWVYQDAEKALYEYLDRYQLNQGAYESLAEDKSSEDFSLTQKAYTYIVGDFINRLKDQDDSVFLEYLDTIIKGEMLSQAFFLKVSGHEKKKFKGTQVYLDSPMIIFLLGYGGETKKGPIDELVSMAKELEGEICCFRHSFEEARNLLTALANMMLYGQLQDSYGPSIEYFIQQGKSETDIRMLVNRLEPDIQNLGIRIIEKPDFSNHQSVIDEGRLEVELSESIPYTNNHALHRDIDSISAISRLRKGKSYFRLEDCKAVFLTMNKKLCKVARNVTNFDVETGAVPVCYTEADFAVLLWLKLGNTTSSLSRKRIAAACYAAINPDSALWNAYLTEIDRLQKQKTISPEDYLLLRHDLHAKSELMRVTRGDETVFSEGTVHQILEQSKLRIQAEEKVKREIAEKERDQSKERLAEATQSYEAIIADKDAKSLQKEIEAVEQQKALKSEQRIAIKRFVNMVGQIIVLLFFIAAFIVAIYTSPFAPGSPNSKILFWAGLIFIVLGNIDLVFGRSIKELIRHLTDWLYEIAIRNLKIQDV